MKTRQFKQLGSLPQARRTALTIEGLLAIGQNVAHVVDELEKCNGAGAHRTAHLLYNVGREEAGKFLVLIDTWRAPEADAKTISRQLGRAGNHLSKLLYAQMADYSIASQNELVSALDRHRQGLFLDGPNEYEWIFRNDLLWERENALYVDLVDSEGQLEWSTPDDHGSGVPVPFSIKLVIEMLATGVVSERGLVELGKAWADFDANDNTHCQEWWRRTWTALQAFEGWGEDPGRWKSTASFVTQRWPMPMVELELDEVKATVHEMVAQREVAHEAHMRWEYGYD